MNPIPLMYRKVWARRGVFSTELVSVRVCIVGGYLVLKRVQRDLLCATLYV